MLDLDLLEDYIWNGYLANRPSITIYGVKYRISHVRDAVSVEIFCQSADHRLVLVCIEKKVVNFGIYKGGILIYTDVNGINPEREISKYLPKTLWYTICVPNRIN